MITLLVSAALAAGTLGCLRELDGIDGAFSTGGRRVHCSANLDDVGRNSIASVDGALDRAAARGEIVELYAHRPGVTVPIDKLDHVLAGARDRGLAFVTYAELASGTTSGPALALSFDDSATDEWTALRPMFASYGARVTFFVTRYHTLRAEQRDQLRQLAADGHDLAAHSVNHLDAPVFVEAHGLASYLRDEALPSIEVLREAGYQVTSYAYPFGARTSELDDALLAHVPLVRSVVFAYGGSVQSPCPH